MPVTLDQLKQWSVSIGELASPLTDEQLQVLLDRATQYVRFVTGRTVEDCPADLLALLEQCVQMRVEQTAQQQATDYVETGADFDQIASFSAGDYSETRRGQGEPKAGRPAQVNSWPALNSALRMVMTDEKIDYWDDQLGEGAPHYAVTEVEWGGVYSLLPPQESEHPFWIGEV